MIVLTKDLAWANRLKTISVQGGWPFAAIEVLPRSKRGIDAEASLAVIDRGACAGSLTGAVSALRSLIPRARIVLACADCELGTKSVDTGLLAGIDDVIVKSWSDLRLRTRLAHLRDAALNEAVRVSADGNLKAEYRSRRVFIRMRGRWTEVPLSGGEFILLYALMRAEGEPLSRERLLAELRSDAGREVEVETVTRRILSLRRALSSWKGAIESVRGGFYRLASSRRRSTT